MAMSLCRPFRALGMSGPRFPGRCPGLSCSAPFGANSKTAQHQNLPRWVVSSDIAADLCATRVLTALGLLPIREIDRKPGQTVRQV